MISVIYSSARRAQTCNCGDDDPVPGTLTTSHDRYATAENTALPVMTNEKSMFAHYGDDDPVPGTLANSHDRYATAGSTALPVETKRKPVIVHPALHIEDEDSSCSDGEANMHTTGPLKSSMTTDTDEFLAMSGQDGSSDYEDQDWHRESQAPAGEWRAEESTFAARSTSGRSHTAQDGE